LPAPPARAEAVAKKKTPKAASAKPPVGKTRGAGHAAARRMH